MNPMNPFRKPEPAFIPEADDRSTWTKGERKRDADERAAREAGPVGPSKAPQSYGEWAAKTIAPVIRRSAPIPVDPNPATDEEKFPTIREDSHSLSGQELERRQSLRG
jgi:hypothetical protein